MKKIKTLLSNSTTMPPGTGLATGGGLGSLSGLPGTGHVHHVHDHEHKADGSCCSGHQQDEHSHDH